MSTQATLQPAPADPVAVDPQHYTVEIEDDRMRVLRIKYGPHEKSAMHGHPRMVAIFLTDGHCRFTYPDGRTEEIRARAGQVQHFDAFMHDPENLSDQPFEVIAVEIRG